MRGYVVGMPALPGSFPMPFTGLDSRLPLDSQRRTQAGHSGALLDHRERRGGAADQLGQGVEGELP